VLSRLSGVQEAVAVAQHPPAAARHMVRFLRYAADMPSCCCRGAKFHKLSRRQAADQALQKYEPFIVQSKNFP
jgi:hypothetical protein